MVLKMDVLSQYEISSLKNLLSEQQSTVVVISVELRYFPPDYHSILILSSCFVPTQEDRNISKVPIQRKWACKHPVIPDFIRVLTFMSELIFISTHNNSNNTKATVSKYNKN